VKITRMRAAAIRHNMALIRHDPTKSAERYDEIIELRMLLMDVMDYSEIPSALRARIERRAKKWGAKGDCV
jgi:hypothetical protein